MTFGVPSPRRLPRAIAAPGRGLRCPDSPQPPRLANDGPSDSEQRPERLSLKPRKAGGGGTGRLLAPRGRSQERGSWPSADPAASARECLGAAITLPQQLPGSPLPATPTPPSASLPPATAPLEAADGVGGAPVHRLISFAPVQ